MSSLRSFIAEHMGAGFFAFILLVVAFTAFMAGGLIIPVPRVEVRNVAVPGDTLIKELNSIPKIRDWSLFYDVNEFRFLKVEPWSLYVKVDTGNGAATKYEFNSRSLEQLHKDIQFLNYVLK